MYKSGLVTINRRDGLGDIVKTKVTLDIMHGKEHTMTGKITSPNLVAQHLRATFCKTEWLMEHVNTPINEIVVMYQSAEQVIRPSAPPDVSVCKGITSCFSFLFLGVPRHYVGGRHTHVCEGEDLDPSRVTHISWWKAVRVLSRPLGQKTSSQSHHQQGFGIVRKGYQILL